MVLWKLPWFLLGSTLLISFCNLSNRLLGADFFQDKQSIPSFINLRKAPHLKTFQEQSLLYCIKLQTKKIIFISRIHHMIITKDFNLLQHYDSNNHQFSVFCVYIITIGLKNIMLQQQEYSHYIRIIKKSIENYYCENKTSFLCSL